VSSNACGAIAGRARRSPGASARRRLACSAPTRSRRRVRHGRAVRRVGRGVGCSDPDECGDAFEAAQASARRVEHVSRESDAAINATRLSAGCKKALVTAPESYVQGAALEGAFGKVVRANKTDSAEDDAAALRAIGALDDLPDEPSARAQLKRLRRNCR
jgi:hypothetical protein